MVFRSDSFLGGAWMITIAEWNNLRFAWPDSYWMDWMRQTPLLKGRVCIRPEMSRVVTFGVTGVNPHP